MRRDDDRKHLLVRAWIADFLLSIVGSHVWPDVL